MIDWKRSLLPGTRGEKRADHQYLISDMPFSEQPGKTFSLKNHLLTYHGYRIPFCILRGKLMIHYGGSRMHRRHIGRELRRDPRARARSSRQWYACPHCDFHDREFHPVCPSCGRPFMRDYIDWQFHPRDPDLAGTFFRDRFWARFWLYAAIIAILGPLVIGLLLGVRFALHLPF